MGYAVLNVRSRDEKYQERCFRKRWRRGFKVRPRARIGIVKMRSLLKFLKNDNPEIIKKSFGLWMIGWGKNWRLQMESVRKDRWMADHYEDAMDTKIKEMWKEEMLEQWLPPHILKHIIEHSNIHTRVKIRELLERALQETVTMEMSDKYDSLGEKD